MKRTLPPFGACAVSSDGMSANVKKSPFFKTTVFAIAFTFFV